ncbi:hypothetical protein B1F75_22195 [Pseudomonas syringae]|nr:hypothetical protein B1F71_00095 [Pseudomonas syringae]RXT90537.1 hypothetical protein B1F75_22195 [Pseudomonas syringae]
MIGGICWPLREQARSHRIFRGHNIFSGSDAALVGSTCRSCVRRTCGSELAREEASAVAECLLCSDSTCRSYVRRTCGSELAREEAGAVAERLLWSCVRRTCGSELAREGASAVAECLLAGYSTCRYGSALRASSA